jgi:ribonuclease HI
MSTVKIYTDGSCNTTLKIGGWAAIIFSDDKKIILKGIEFNTSHNRMELTAVIESLKFVEKQINSEILVNVYSDSQYVIRIPERIEKLKSNYFLTAGGKPVRNTDLIEKLIHLNETNNIEFIKVKAHQKKNELENYNREADKISRKTVRNYMNNN